MGSEMEQLLAMIRGAMPQQNRGGGIGQPPMSMDRGGGVMPPPMGMPQRGGGIAPPPYGNAPTGPGNGLGGNNGGGGIMPPPNGGGFGGGGIMPPPGGNMGGGMDPSVLPPQPHGDIFPALMNMLSNGGGQGRAYAGGSPTFNERAGYPQRPPMMRPQPMGGGMQSLSQIATRMPRMI